MTLDLTRVPTVSVVMGVYNGERYLRQAVESILTQTFRNFEFIIINDASTDGTARILREFSDPRIRLIVNERNEGLTRCLIRGCREARGKYIARMDADDVSHPERFEREVAFLEANQDHGAVGCCCECIDPDGSTYGAIRYPLRHEDIVSAMREFNAFIHGSALLRADVYHAIGGYREFFRYTQDYDLWLRMCEGARLANLPELLYSHRHHDRKILVRHIHTQRAFGHLAQKLAQLRKASGTDPLAEGDYETVNRLFDEARPKGFFEKKIRLSHYYADLAKNCAPLRMKYLSRLLLASFLNNPFSKTLWRFLFSADFRGRIRQGFSRTLRLKTREGL